MVLTQTTQPSLLLVLLRVKSWFMHSLRHMYNLFIQHQIRSFVLASSFDQIKFKFHLVRVGWAGVGGSDILISNCQNIFLMNIQTVR